MKIVWFTWKDLRHPHAGGAEVLNEQIAARLARDGHAVTLVVAGFAGGAEKEQVNGYTVVRVGGRYTVYLKAGQYFKRYLSDNVDLVIEEVNTVPFLTALYTKRTPSIYLFYQLCRQIWFYQMVFPLSLVGYVAEPVYLRYMAWQKRPVLTESQSTKDDLVHYGFKRHNTTVFRVGIETKPVSDLSTITKYDQPTMLSLGAIRNMKRPHHQIEAFELAKKDLPKLQLIIAGAGSGRYVTKVMDLIATSPFHKDIHYLGKVSKEKKIELMQKSHVICVTSVKEGWGLIVTEANSQGTVAVVYNVDGLRDSVRHNKTGLICTKNTPTELATCVVDVLKDQAKYSVLRQNAWKWSKELTFETSYQDVLAVIHKTVGS